MIKANKAELLKEAIVLLEVRQGRELKLLKDQFNCTYESIKPINLIKNTLRDITSLPLVKNTIVNNLIGLTAGYLSKTIVIGGTHNPIKKILGTLLEFAVANVVSEHSETVKEKGTNLLQSLFSKKSDIKKELVLKNTSFE